MAAKSTDFIGGMLLSAVILTLPYYLLPAGAQYSPAQDPALQTTPQDTPDRPPQNTEQQAPAPQAQQQAPAQERLTAAQLDQIVAPIALYPDPLLAEVLMASVYPVDVVEAERWLEKNKRLKGDARKAALEKQDWDDSIKALTGTPAVLEMMSRELDWTQKLGDAVVNQQPEVMDAVQRLRARAQSTDKLKTTKQQIVRDEQVQGRRVIAIEPAVPDELYVPYYDPAVVYGDWAYADYPPYYFEPPYYIGTGLLAAGLAFGAGYAIANWRGWWGGNVNWNGGGNNIVINRPGNGLRPSNPIAGVGDRWQPRVDHRQALSNRGGQAARDFRSSKGQQVLNPNNKLGSGNRAVNTAAGKNRPAQRSRVSHGGARQNAVAKRASAQPKVAHRAGAGHGRARVANANRGRHAAAHRRVAVGHFRGGSFRGGFARGGGRATVGLGSGFRGGGGLRAGGGGGGRFGGGRGGRRSDLLLKHDIVLLSRLDNGLNLYRFSYNGSEKAYVGVIAQEVQQIRPDAVQRGADGYLRVYYEKLGVKFQTYDHWLESARTLKTSVNHTR